MSNYIYIIVGTYSYTVSHDIKLNSNNMSVSRFKSLVIFRNDGWKIVIKK